MLDPEAGLFEACPLSLAPPPETLDPEEVPLDFCVPPPNWDWLKPPEGLGGGLDVPLDGAVRAGAFKLLEGPEDLLVADLLEEELLL